jgi:hypothetical protein
MGWKAIRDHYRIGHIVQVVEDKGICIGSPYVHNLITIRPDGTITPNRIIRDGEGGELGRYMAEMKADPEQLRRLIDQPDTFERAITVYTYEGGSIVERQCEELGWPNVTHDGFMQYENTYSPDRDLVRTWAISNAEAGVEWRRTAVKEAEETLRNAKEGLAQREADLRQLQGIEP